MRIEVVVGRDGGQSGIYSDALAALLRQAGVEVAMARASHVEPTVDGRWTADLSPVDGPTLGPFETRADALSAEAEWLRLWLDNGQQGPPCALEAVANTCPGGVHALDCPGNCAGGVA